MVLRVAVRNSGDAHLDEVWLYWFWDTRTGYFRRLNRGRGRPGFSYLLDNVWKKRW